MKDDRTICNLVTFSIDNVATRQILGPNPDRVAILISAQVGSATAPGLTIGWQQSDTLVAGIPLGVNSSPLLLTREAIGSAIEQPLFAFSQAATYNGALYEFIKAP